MRWTGAYPQSRFKQHFVVTLGKMLQPSASTPSDELISYLRAANIDWHGVSQDDLKKMWFSTEDKNKYLLENGDLVVLEGGDVGRAAILNGVNGRLGFQNSVHRVRAFKGSLVQFAYYWLQHLKISGYFELVCSKATLAHFTAEKFAETPFPNIPVDTQKRIVAFLDRETRRIDNLIGKKERLVELLNARLQSDITQAVTKGLDRGVIMVDSNVDWIGDVPEHWKVMKLGYLGRCSNGINIGGAAFGSGYPFISYGDVYKNRTLPSCASGLVQSTETDRKSYDVQAGDVFFTRTSETIEEIGFSSVCRKTLQNAVFAGFLIRFRPTRGKLHSIFSTYAFQHAGLRNYFSKQMNLITRASLSQDLLRNMHVALPPLEEQRAIGRHLERMEAKILQIVLKTETSISRLKEYRAALITAAVTGQIDVDTYDRAGKTSATLDRIEEEMQA